MIYDYVPGPAIVMIGCGFGPWSADEWTTVHSDYPTFDRARAWLMTMKPALDSVPYFPLTSTQTRSPAALRQ
jgi:hypothetical protein